MQHFTENKLSFLPSQETRRYITKCSRYIIPFTLLRALSLSAQGYLFMFLISDILQGSNSFTISIMLCIIILCAFVITLTNSYKETFVGKVRVRFFKDLATKRIELANDKEAIEISQKIYDWQMHNGGPVSNGNTLIEKHMIALLQAITALIMIVITLDVKSLFLIIGLCVIAFLTSFLLRSVDSSVKRTMTEGMEKLIENDRKGDYDFALLSSEFSKMKCIRSNNTAHFVEDKYASFMNPMMKVFRKEERGKLGIALIETVIAITMTIAFVFMFNENLKLPQILAVLNLMLGAISLFRFRNDITLNDSRMHIFLEYLNRTKSESTTQEDNTLTNAIELNNISFRYPEGKVNALNDISFNFEKGKIYSVVGANGSGKTTLMKLILGILQPDTGSVVASTKNAFSYCPQNPVQFSFTVGENIAMCPNVNNARINKLLKALSLDVIAEQNLGMILHL